jgi:hypothetical protein
VNAEVADRVVELLGEGATFREAGALVNLSARDFDTEWSRGASDLAGGHDSDAATWVQRCRASYASFTASIRAEAVEEAGSRRSSDLLAILARREAEKEPDAVSEEADVRTTAMLDVEGMPVEWRERHEAAKKDLHALFCEYTHPDAVAARRAMTA